MVFGVILAGGVGSRMGDAQMPKQFLTIGKKPVVVHTLEKFYNNSRFDMLLLLCPPEWIEHSRALLNRYFQDAGRVAVLEGGETRNETIMNAIHFIEERYGLTEDTILVTHDAVRPFVTARILDDNIRGAMEFGACDTVIPASDTIVESKDGKIILAVPDRTRMYQGQTPQSFRAKKLKELYLCLTEEEKALLTDAAKIFVMKGEPVLLVKGEAFNMKITYPFDLKVAQTLADEADNCETF